ncbi:MAG: SRPBCC family protein [Bacteroidetes bacterium]|nr:SRPBCC family protein [Bacteroidota bacterium]
MINNKITVQATVSADINKVWSSWTLPEHITKWNFASDDWHCPSATNDLKAGGRFCATMASKDGSMSFDFEGIYDEVIHHRKIAYSLADGRQIAILFESEGDKTRVIETFDPENENSMELQRAGWQSILDNFKAYTEQK